MKTTTPAIVLFGLLVLADRAQASTQNQSLAEVAEKTTRRTDGARSKTYSDADLKGSGAAPRAAAPTTNPTTRVSAAGDVRREDVVRAVMPAVVTLETPETSGSGFFVASDLVITNRHVVGSASGVRVRFANGEAVLGTVVHTAADADLAVVRVEQGPDHPVLPFADAASVQVGEEVLALGSALGMLQGTVTRGIVSAVRTSMGVTLIQTDAAINPGNSGGPLINRLGQAVGITTAKLSAAESLGFAIATDHATKLLEGRALVADRTATSASESQGRLDAVLNPSITSESDAVRDAGLVQFERTVAALSRQSDALDEYWRRYRTACGAAAIAGSASPTGREWFGVWTSSDVGDLHPNCASARADIAAAGRRIDEGMRDATERARVAGVFPGSVRAARVRYRMEWPGWEE
jgi:V8-like Glu-specific endopeptidase